mmetsp:Transcript_52683/g.163478  ORF Transcript_52683/g.163478 Transcript_52683/m.163478 type:complete len:83 (+) Transcript_52683:531-779(+)
MTFSSFQYVDAVAFNPGSYQLLTFTYLNPSHFSHNVSPGFVGELWLFDIFFFIRYPRLKQELQSLYDLRIYCVPITKLQTLL